MEIANEETVKIELCTACIWIMESNPGYWIIPNYSEYNES